MQPYYDDGNGIVIYHGDCRDILPMLGGQADALMTDPPFNVGKDYGMSKDDLPDEEYAALLRLMVEHGPTTQAWIAPKIRLGLMLGILPDALPVVVRRGAQGPLRWGWSDQFDMLIVRGRPRRPISNLWDGIRLRDEGYFFTERWYGHPGYTSYPIMARAIDYLTEPGSCVIDPFAGTGTTLRAAKDLGRRAIGIEISPHWCDIAVRRLAQQVLPLDIPS